MLLTNYLHSLITFGKHLISTSIWEYKVYQFMKFRSIRFSLTSQVITFSFCKREIFIVAEMYRFVFGMSTQTPQCLLHRIK